MIFFLPPAALEDTESTERIPHTLRPKTSMPPLRFAWLCAYHPLGCSVSFIMPLGTSDQRERVVKICVELDL